MPLPSMPCCAPAPCLNPAALLGAAWPTADGGITVEHARAMPPSSAGGWRVSVWLNRPQRELNERELALIDQLRLILARLLRDAGAPAHAAVPLAGAGASVEPPALSPALPLTCREHEVLRWAAAGKTDRDIADILAISHRTVHKHLQRVYSKLGVETRTAAVMRAIEGAWPEAGVPRAAAPLSRARAASPTA